MRSPLRLFKNLSNIMFGLSCTFLSFYITVKKDSQAEEAYVSLVKERRCKCSRGVYGGARGGV